MDIMSIEVALRINAVREEAERATRVVESVPRNFRRPAQAGIEKAAAVAVARMAIEAGYAVEPEDDPSLSAELAVDDYHRKLMAIGRAAFAAAAVAVIEPLLPHDADI